ncbi:MAG: AraC family transcriptional regulator [Clostridia bacterium]|nr:AraC family transcriptional regulator [Clostridia bacterium]
MSFYESEVEGYGYLYFSHVKKDKETPPHFHSAIELLFCVDGEQDVSVGGEVYTLKKGDGCFVDSYVVHSLKPSGAEMYAVVGDVHFFSSVFSSFGNRVPLCIFKFESTELLETLYALYSKDRADKAGITEINEAIVKILLAELNESGLFTERTKDTQNELVARILQYANDNLRSDLSLSELSLKFGYSSTYLSRILHRYLGMNWNIYVGNLRARAVHAVLSSERDISVLDAALMCGFDSLNTFYRAYRRVFDKAPLEK